MNAIAQKSPDSELVLTIDWQQSPLRHDESPAYEIGWHVEPARTGEPGLQLVRHSLKGRISRATFQGGAPGRAYLISAAIATSQGRMVVRVITLRVSAG